MKLFGLFKPEYLYRPEQMIKRLRADTASPQLTAERLPWGLVIQVHPSEVIGGKIVKMGVFDLTVTEALWRLIDPGDTAADVGANIGYMTSIMGCRAGQKGRVFSFEPHPTIFKELEANINQWKRDLPTPFFPQQVAVSDQTGPCQLNIPELVRDNGNAGLSTLEPSEESTSTVQVERIVLDDIFPAPERVGLVKMDVEGHELSALKGATSLLSTHRVRDWVFEEHGAYPTETTKLLESFGYTVFRLAKRLTRPALVSPTIPAPFSVWEQQNFLATVEPDRAIQRFRKAGWQSLTSGRGKWFVIADSKAVAM